MRLPFERVKPCPVAYNLTTSPLMAISPLRRRLDALATHSSTEIPIWSIFLFKKRVFPPLLPCEVYLCRVFLK